VSLPQHSATADRSADTAADALPAAAPDADEPSTLASRQSTTGVRARLRRTRGGRQFLRAAAFLLGLLFILLGLALVALPGPLTIPPILLGLYIWASEFAWADRLLQRAKKSAREAWEQARRKPVTTSLVTGGGLLALGVGLYLVSRYDLVSRAREVVGL
jgi:hypothetical protein